MSVGKVFHRRGAAELKALSPTRSRVRGTNSSEFVAERRLWPQTIVFTSFKIRYLKYKCMKALNLIRVVAQTSWGADQHTLLHLYRSLVRSKLDYGCVVYGSARNSCLRMLDPVQNHALRLCLGAYRTSSSLSLCVLANEPFLYIRRRKLSIEYCLKLIVHSKSHIWLSLWVQI